MTDYQIEDTFISDPEDMGWSVFAGTSLDWDSLEKIGGSLGSDVDARYSKFLGKAQLPTDNIISRFILMAENIGVNSAPALIGLFNSKTVEGQDECFAIKLLTDSNDIRPQVYIAYNDGATKIESTSTYSLTAGTKYVISLRYVPEDGKAYVGIYDFLTETLLSEISVNIDSTKSFSLNQAGISEMSATYANTADVWVYEVDALGEPDPIIYASLYCTPSEARLMTNLDTVNDMSDSMIAQIETIYAIPQVNSHFRSEGYDAPFDTGDDTPPLIRTITALLTSAYAARKSYIGHDPNESPVYAAVLKEVNSIWKSLLNGELELLDIDNNWIERTLETSSGMLSTTDGQTALFSLDDVPDITEVISGGLYDGDT